MPLDPVETLAQGVELERRVRRTRFEPGQLLSEAGEGRRHLDRRFVGAVEPLHDLGLLEAGLGAGLIDILPQRVDHHL